MSIQDMADDAPDKVENTQSNIDQVDAQIDEKNEEINSLTNDMCHDITNDSTGSLTIYLDSTKVIELQYLDASYVQYGTNYGNIDYTDGGATDWSIIDTTGNTVYNINKNWDNDPIIQQYIDDFAFANDYLTRPLTSGASYGLIPTRDALLSAKSLLEENKALYEDSEDVLGRYT